MWFFDAWFISIDFLEGHQHLGQTSCVFPAVSSLRETYMFDAPNSQIHQPSFRKVAYWKVSLNLDNQENLTVPLHPGNLT